MERRGRGFVKRLFEVSCLSLIYIAAALAIIVSTIQMYTNHRSAREWLLVNRPLVKSGVIILSWKADWGGLRLENLHESRSIQSSNTSGIVVQHDVIRRKDISIFKGGIGYQDFGIVGVKDQHVYAYDLQMIEVGFKTMISAVLAMVATLLCFSHVRMHLIRMLGIERRRRGFELKIASLI